MDLKKLQFILDEHKQPKFRYKQIVQQAYQTPASSWEECSSLPKSLIEILNEELPFMTMTIVKEIESDDVIKLLFQIGDSAERVEGVIMKHDDGRRTLCLSCQVGCPMGCYFCATGTLGLKKNLTAYDILDMVKLTQEILCKRNEELTNIVYMGMGEPFANYPAVKQSLQLIHDVIGIGWRKISVSTSGIPKMITMFAKDFPQVNLAISLHAATNKKRSQLMPVNDRFPLEELMRAVHDYVNHTGRKVFFEYLVIAGFNDTDADVAALTELLDHPLFHLNLIRFHETEAVAKAYGKKWKAPSREELRIFMEKIEGAGISYTLRRSFGEQIDAACGMLALKNPKE